MCRGIGHIFTLALLGFLAILLVGPVVALVSALLAVIIALLAVLLPFVVIGFLVWGGYQIVSHTPSSAWRNIREAGKNIAQFMVVTPFKVCKGACVGTVNATKTVLRRSWYTLGVISRVLLDAVFGGLVGALLGFVTMSDSSPESFRGIVIATFVGAVTGALVRVSQTPRVPREVNLNVEKVR
jgi:hypothetical protein